MKLQERQSPFSDYAMRDGLRRFARKLKEGRGVTVAFLGGSVTEGAGASDGERTSYRALTCRYLTERYPLSSPKFVNAAIGGTDSVYGAFRLKEHVLRQGLPIDLLFVEFAVNDAGDRDASVRAMEGIVRQARRACPDIDICFLYTARKEDVELFRTEGKEQANVDHHEEVAERYRLPSVHIAREIYRRVAAGEIGWERISGDNVHPNDFGYALYAEFLRDFLDTALRTEDGGAPEPGKETPDPAPLHPLSYAVADLRSPHEIGQAEGWEKLEDWTFEHVCYWKLPGRILFGNRIGASFRFDFYGTAVGFSMLAGIDLGNVDYSIDGGPFQTAELFDEKCADFYRPKIVLLADSLAPGAHSLDIRISESRHALSEGHAVRLLNFLVNG
ncbi:SGNH/GDSL hydrolase family protein [Cohnella zeiphila]|uniref:SGNH hydrolase-type esterase domain-containing protein n=1 Tax=Cohnella zeiphila TaxID=2761120 RepID=A0A7X0SVX9_9BACL|nr:SGNH/GDSL hydrolase family protein [Cohnella zeiphila]MBB6735930.1 hypothetical protein [Cohnella zeiphila]